MLTVSGVRVPISCSPNVNVLSTTNTKIDKLELVYYSSLFASVHGFFGFSKVAT